MRHKLLVFLLLTLFSCAIAHAAETSYCEVAAVSGDVQLKRMGQLLSPLQQGAMIQKGDSLIVAKGASADLAFDPQWENTTRISENTRVLIRWINPVRLEILSGDLYAKLDRLPKGSTFEVVTPTAIATVRGTKFRTTYANGSTTVYNDSETSLVYVYHVDENGNRAGRAIILKPGETTTIVGAAQVDDTMLEELQESRNREDQDQLNGRSRNQNTDLQGIPDNSPPESEYR